MSTPLNIDGMFEMIKGTVFKVKILESEGSALYKIQLVSGAILEHVHGRFLTFLTSPVRRTDDKRHDDIKSHISDDEEPHRRSQTL